MLLPKLGSKIGVYLIVSPSNGRYVGSSKRLDKRFNRYKNYSCKAQLAIFSSLKKYGYENHTFKVLMYCDVVDLYFWERVFGDIYLASANFSNGLNLSLPAYEDIPAMLSDIAKQNISRGGLKRFEKQEERDKIGENTKKLFNNPEYRKRISDLHKERCSTAELKKERSQQQINYFKDPLSRKNVSTKIKEYLNNNPEQKEKNLRVLSKFYKNNPTIRSDRLKKRHLENPNLGKEHGLKLKQRYIDNPELREIASKKTKEQFSNPENHPSSKKVIDTETGEIFPSLTTVARRLKKPIQTVRNWVKEKVYNPTSYKYLQL